MRVQGKRSENRSRVRAKVEHLFRILKRIFGFDNARYRGLAKNHNPTVRLLRVGKPLFASHTAGLAEGVVSPQAGKRLPQTESNAE